MIMSDVIRSFIAVPIEVSPSLRALIHQLGSLGRPLKAVDTGHLHLTVKFLGETPWTVLPEVTAVIEAEVRQLASFQAEITGLGAFPDARRARVVWCGLSPNGPLPELAARLNDRLGELGFPREQRTFQPHVTLARVKGRPPRGLASVLDQHEATTFGGQLIDRVVFYQSELTPTGPRYTILSEQLFECG